MSYDFRTLSPADFEDLMRDLLGRELGMRFEAFCAGPDGGMDGRHSTTKAKSVLQAKHYAGSTFPQFKAAMVKERTSIERLNADRYLLATSCNLTPANKAELAGLVGPTLRDEADIFGPGDLNSLLKKHPDVEKAHIELWMSSAAVLDRVLNAALHTFAALAREEIEAKVRVYAPNPSFSEASETLERRHVVIISGPAGVGKTTLAEMLAYVHLGLGWALVPIRSLDDGLASLGDTKKQVFLFDDFLEKVALDKRALAVKDSDLARFINRVRRSANARFILTTRAYIFEEARRVSEHLADQRLDVTKYVLDVGVYTRRIRARILYNHLMVAKTPPSYIASLIESALVPKLVDLKNYNPRVVEWMTDRLQVEDLPSDRYPTAFRDALDNPRQVWDTAFRTHIDHKCRHLLIALYFCSDYGASVDDIKVSYQELHPRLCTRYGQAHDPKDFEEAVRILEGGFISIRGDRVSYINLSLKDYLHEYLLDPPLIAEIVWSTRRANWMQSAWAFLRNTQLDFGGVDIWNAFADVCVHLGKWPRLRRSKSAPGEFAIVDSGNTGRVRTILEIWEASRDDRFSDAALAFAQGPAGGWDPWSSDELAEMAAALRDGDYGEVPCRVALADTLEVGLIGVLNAWSTGP